MEEHLATIKDAAAAVEDAQDWLVRAVRAAVRAGETWGAVGAALGISRQAAQQRFGMDWTPPPRPPKPEPWDPLTAAPPFDVRKALVRHLRGVEELFRSGRDRDLYGESLDDIDDDDWKDVP